MEKWIYKITNSVNDKIYIGQSVNPIKRFKEHILKSNQKDVKGLHAAIKKYGKENFKMEIIEGPIKNYNEREIYWIQYYNSYNNGYNLTKGGEDPPQNYGEQSVLSKFSDTTIKEIQEDLLFSNLSYQEISEKYEVSLGYIKDINQGVTRKNNQLKYPLRIQSNIKLSSKQVNIIIDQLINTTKSVEEISRENNISNLSIYRINEGIRNKKENIEYPIRLPGEKISQILLKKIINNLLDNKLKFSSIEKKYNLSKSTINRINNGKSYFRNHISYPIRPPNKRIYKENL